MFRTAIHQFQEQSRLLLIQSPGLDTLPLVLRPREQSPVLHLLLVRQLVMLSDICLQQFKIPMPTFLVCHI